MSDVTLQFRSLTTGDDGYWTASTFINGASNQYIGNFGTTPYNSFYKFRNTIIPKNAIIVSAYFKPSAADSDANNTLNLNIYGNDTVDPVSPTTREEAEALVLTSAVAWNSVAAFTGSISYNSSDLKTIIQGLVDKADWDIGKDIMLVVKDNSSTANAHRIINTVESGPTYTGADIPVLEITWTLPADWMIKNSGVSGDDGRAFAGGGGSFYSNETWGQISTEEIGFHRFPSVAVPQARVIPHAYFIITAAQDGFYNLGPGPTIYFNNENTAVAPTSYAIAAAKTKTGGTAWATYVLGKTDKVYHSPNLAADLQSIFNRAGWASGNALMVITNPAAGNYSNLSNYFYDNGSKYPLLLIQLGIPPAPSGVGVIGGDHKETISWTAVAGAASYNLYWSSTPGVTKLTGTKIEGVTSPYDHTDLTGDVIYYYVVTAVDALGESEDSVEVSAKTDLPIPDVPTASAVGGVERVTVSWSPTSFAISYNLYWSISPGITIATGTKVTGATSPYYHIDLPEVTRYFYIVTAVNSAGESEPSTEVNAVTDDPNPPAPLGVKAEGGEKQVTVSWFPALYATSYNIYWARTTGVTKANGYKITGVTSPHNHAFRLNGIVYYYIVTAVNAVGESDASAEASARTFSYTAPPTPPAPAPVQFLGGAVGNSPYLLLFTSQYQNSGNLLNFADKILDSADDVVALLETFLIAFDLDSAVGDQLDVLGEIIGVSRYLKFTPTEGSPPVEDSAILDDATYRVLLIATIGINHWDGRISSIKPLWERLFPDGNLVIKDELDMSITVTPAGVFSSLILQLIMHDLIIPRPEGVLINYVIGEMPFFGFDLDNEYIAGFDKGKWA